MIKSILFCTIAIVILWNCSPIEEPVKEGDVQLEFSTDTLRFDTVFTELGSATQILKVFNRYDERIRISKISLQGNQSAKFRMNVDGTPTDAIQNIEIAANDSLYIFCEVTINPDEDISASPFVIETNIRFETNEGEQQVLLEAWGQNANYLPSRFGKGTFNVLSGDVIFDDPKPYVIYGFLFVDNGILTIPAGTKIYVHGALERSEEIGTYNDGVIWVLANGQIKIEGTLEDPVVIQGDRLEEAFEDEPGQWGALRIGQGSTGNVIEHTIIKNSIVGVRVDSAATLTAKNMQIYNTSGEGIIGRHAQIDMENCLVYNNGSTSVYVDHGGDYNFDYCTFASYGVDASALYLSNFICYVPNGIGGCDLGASYRLKANFRNSIFFGSRKNELVLFDAVQTGKEAFDYNFENCLVRIDDDFLENIPDFYENCGNCPKGLTNQELLFEDVNEDDYHLDSLSVAQNIGLPIDGIKLDLEGNQRDEMTPDVGCYERQ